MRSSWLTRMARDRHSLVSAQYRSRASRCPSFADPSSRMAHKRIRSAVQGPQRVFRTRYRPGGEQPSATLKIAASHLARRPGAVRAPVDRFPQLGDPLLGAGDRLCWRRLRHHWHPGHGRAADRGRCGLRGLFPRLRAVLSRSQEGQERDTSGTGEGRVRDSKSAYTPLHPLSDAERAFATFSELVLHPQLTELS